ncbi:sodium/glutamate symporter [Kushneria phosphatilytica]|uniref:Sodium:glutamate symporter n=1 Tax=Kushneria phosphatilytica TaxID=657387 RepID=A0A1S1NRB8_9GAMM|nr:sodium/glutamate symporter [Kushneria phosphatilytica]OHV07604.1 sodium:glutamate symporter [Kushneria phosphatilytica]QEL10091.1 sodium:glutamate symporter [Kushneria phosphatilytica]
MGSTFHGVIAFALMAALLVIGSLLRSRLPWLRTAMVPGSIVAGLIGFMGLSLGLIPGYGPKDFTSLAFHFFTLSFMSLCLTGSPKRQDDGQRSGVTMGGLWLTLIWTASLGAQAVIGYGLMAGYDALSGQHLSPLLGAIVTHGFTQGPGQALTYGNIWEQGYGITHAAQVGVIFASLGFLAAFLVGVPVARYCLKKGLNTNRDSTLNADFVAGFHPLANQPSAGRQVSHSGTVDSFAWHIGLLGIAYVITYLWLSAMQPLVAGNRVLSVFFSYNLFFAHGLTVCVLMRLAIDRLGWSHRVDDDTLKRITSGSVDFMVVATLMSIQVAVLSALLVPILLVAVAITLVTLCGALAIGRMSGRFGPERALTAFGCCCGSTGTGLLLLRMLDNDFTTPVPKELAFFNIAIIVVNIPTLFFFAPIAPALGAWTYIAIFGGYALLALACIPLLRRWQQRTDAAQPITQEPSLP